MFYDQSGFLGRSSDTRTSKRGRRNGKRAVKMVRKDDKKARRNTKKKARRNTNYLKLHQ